MASALTADQVISQFETLVGDELDTTTELFLLNEVKDTLETERAWVILKRLDQSQTANAGDTFQTMKTLPSDFAMPSPRGIYVGTDLVRYDQIPFESQIDFQSITYAYYIDLFNGKYALCGSVTKTGTIQFFYQANSATLKFLADAGLPWIFPARFHPILPYLMAKKYFAIDQGDKSKAWDDRWDIFIQEMKSAMISWDDAQQTLALQNEMNMFIDPSKFPNIVDMDQGGRRSMFG